MITKEIFSLNVTEKAAPVVDKLCSEAADLAYAICPKRTGRLANSIYWERALPDEWRIGSKDVYYAIFVEFGTRKMYPRSFLRPAALSVFRQ